jgi:hypothetical protein
VNENEGRLMGPNRDAEKRIMKEMRDDIADRAWEQYQEVLENSW